MNRTECLQAAKEIVTSDRENIYGSPEDNFELVSEFWVSYLSSKSVFYPQDVANMMILLKVARAATGKFNADNYIDIAGYAACACEIGDRGSK